MLAALALVAALLLVGTAQSAQAQLFPWGGWSGPSPWQPAPRRQRRARHYVEPKDEKPATPFPTPTGPLLVVVSIAKQNVTVYEGTTQVAQAPISSGTSSNPTPTGIFSILEKNRYHYSNLYGGAPMPFMQRLTNSGVAMHAGDLPGYPASHGCIRLPYSFARNFFGITGIGARVIVSDEELTPAEFHSTRLIAPLPPDDLAQANPAAGGATAETAAGTQSDVSGVGVTPVAAAMSEKPRTRAMAAAARAAERVQLVANISSAEAAKVAAVAHVKAMTEAARAAKEAIRKARNEAGRFAEAARKASRAAAKAEERFAELTGKMAKIEADKLMRIEIDKIAAEEMLEERKVVELSALARAAKALADKQAHAAKRAVAKAAEAEKTRRASLEGVEKANQAIADAKAALAAVDAIEARKDLPVSIFVNAKTGRLIAKLGFVPVIDVPVTISQPGTPLGTHVFTATALTDRERSMRWSVVSLKADSPTRAPRRKRRHEDEAYVAAAGADADAARALDRIEIPKDAVERLAELMKPGSSLIVSDYPLSRETSNRTEFVIEPWRSRRHVENQDYRYE